MVINNTGCALINNATPDEWTVIDGENRDSRRIPASGSANFNGTIFPWCSSAADIQSKAFRFFRAGVGQFYMFQTNEGFSAVFFSAYNGGNPSFEGRQAAGNASGGYVDINIDGNGSPTVVRA